MRILVVVAASPWGGTRSSAALRFTRAAVAAGDRIAAVFFRDDGVYNALPGQMSDDGLEGPQAQWQALAAEQGIDLLLCPAAAARRLPPPGNARGRGAFREAGLAHMIELMDGCDRVVSF